ncbi:putative transcription factor S-II [Ordospora pajunii]|uniref:putative transcription factor S-II n=1 Tax=Ordospora pajunii TaxID=3039483 RepID=UPI0029528694|nr:putative transcription factor S-II [Ordospora pajunii]KAH9410982.1 putative transcription factor S-II [Ordospora pajunii]
MDRKCHRIEPGAPMSNINGHSSENSKKEADAINDSGEAFHEKYTAVENDASNASSMPKLLKKRMQGILRRDNLNNSQGKPAIEKINNVAEVSETLMNRAVQESLLDEGILDEVRGWLEPLPDRSMPNIKVKKRLLDALRNMKIHREHLLQSGIGKIVYFYSINPKEEKEVRSMAKQLVQKWTQEIFSPECDE